MATRSHPNWDSLRVWLIDLFTLRTCLQGWMQNIGLEQHQPARYHTDRTLVGTSSQSQNNNTKHNNRCRLRASALHKHSYKISALFCSQASIHIKMGEVMKWPYASGATYAPEILCPSPWCRLYAQMSCTCSLAPTPSLSSPSSSYSSKVLLNLEVENYLWAWKTLRKWPALSEGTTGSLSHLRTKL